MSVTRIAETAGVSIATVSRVLNNSRPVHPAVAQKVHNAIRLLELGPAQLRRRQRSTDRHTTIAIVTLGQQYREWFEMPVIANVVADLNRAAQEMKLGVLTAEMPDPSKLHPVISRPEVRGALVFISSGTRLTTRDTEVLRSRLPLVRVMGGQLAPTDIDHVAPDNNAIGHVAGRYLIEQGVKQLAFLTSSPLWDFSRLRAQGLMAVAEQERIATTMYLQVDRTAPITFCGADVVMADDLEHLVDRLKANRKGRLGLFVPRDAETVTIYQILRARGLTPGKDVVVVSCDNESIRLSALSPRPASIDLNTAEIARYAVSRLSSRMQNSSEPPARILVSPRLVLGG